MAAKPSKPRFAIPQTAVHRPCKLARRQAHVAKSERLSAANCYPAIEPNRSACKISQRIIANRRDCRRYIARKPPAIAKGGAKLASAAQHAHSIKSEIADSHPACHRVKPARQITAHSKFACRIAHPNPQIGNRQIIAIKSKIASCARIHQSRINQRIASGYLACVNADRQTPHGSIISRSAGLAQAFHLGCAQHSPLKAEHMRELKIAHWAIHCRIENCAGKAAAFTQKPRKNIGPQHPCRQGEIVEAIVGKINQPARFGLKPARQHAIRAINPAFFNPRSSIQGQPFAYHIAQKSVPRCTKCCCWVNLTQCAEITSPIGQRNRGKTRRIASDNQPAIPIAPAAIADNLRTIGRTVTGSD